MTSTAAASVSTNITTDNTNTSNGGDGLSKDTIDTTTTSTNTGTTCSNIIGCSTPGCTKVVEQLLSCPKCMQLNLPPTYFCGQECYTNNYKQHKKVHIIKQQQQVVNTGPAAVVPVQPVVQQQQQQHRKMVPYGGVSCSIDSPRDVQIQLPDWARTYNFTGLLRPALYSPQRTVPAHIRQPDYANHPSGVSISEQRDKSSHTNIRVYTQRELDGIDCNGYGIRHVNKMGREVLDVASKALRVGITTDEIDRIVYDACIERNIYPSPLNYYNFPKSLCTSVNEVICHGIPDYRELCDGDICNLDISVYNQGGYHSDLNETYFIGNCDDDSKKLVQTSYECLALAIELVKPGTLYRDLGTVIEKHAKLNKCSVVRTYCGHGIGSLFHTIPNIPHYNKNKAKGIMKVGHIFTIEPMINFGPKSQFDTTWDDNWTAVTLDGSRSSQFEHTILVTETGYELLTARTNEPKMIWDCTKQQR
jgi:methionyl aminopeptidase